MSAKWRALQHRHRYTYSAIIFPHSYLESLNLLPSDISSLKFFIDLKELISLNSSYSQVSHVKKLASAFGDLLVSGGESLVSVASRFYLEILFLENSLPLHRTLVSVLAKTRNFLSVIGGCFSSLCDEYGGVKGKGKRFCVSRAALSIMSSPKLGYLLEIVEDCTILVAWDVVYGLNSVVSEINDSSRPSPIAMEQCQEALSCLYYLLQKFPLKFSSNGCQSSLASKDSNVLEMMVTVILDVLKSQAFSRDCFVAAGVSFCAVLQVCLSPEEVGVLIIAGIFHGTTSSSVISCKSEIENVILKVPYKGDLCSEIHNFAALSRLCLIRGILTAVSRTVINTRFAVSTDYLKGFGAHENSNTSSKTILYDGILPELCNYCENPTDSHFNFHALTVMQICLQQTKTSMLTNLADSSESYDPIPEVMGTRILRIIWDNLEDPLSQTVKQVHLIFDLFLDIQSSLRWANGSERIKLFLQKIASDLLRLGPRCKGRYVPLASLSKRLGAKTILDMTPDLLFQTIQAYTDDDVCCAVTSFLKCFLELLRDECWSSDGIERGYASFRGHCLPPFLSGLASGFPKLRSNLNTYALPVLLEVDVDSIFPMLAFISVGQNGEDAKMLYPEFSCTDIDLTVEQKVALLVSLLKVSRLLALIDGDIDLCDSFSMPLGESRLATESIDHYALVCIKGIGVKILVEWLVLALTHLDESLRVDAAESLFINPKTSSLPSHLELNLMKEAVPLNMRCCSSGFQMKWSSLFRKFFSRVRTALERQFKQGSWQPLAHCENNGEYPCNRTEGIVVNRAEYLYRFMRWLSCFLFFSCYPSAPYERKIMAMDLILIMVDVWSIIPPSEGKCDSVSPEGHIYPYNEGITLPNSTLLLVGSIIDSWDRLRESSFRILLHFPNPLPGISSQAMVQEVIAWAKKLVCSPRVRESDAGALTLRLMFRKYVLELGWIVKASNVTCIRLQSELINGDYQICKSRFPVVEYLNSLIDWLHAVVVEGEKDLYKACQNSFVHGVLLTLRYTFEELDWSCDIVLSSFSEMRHALEKLLELVMRITSLALWVVSADAWYLPEDMDDMADDDNFLVEVPVEIDGSISSSEPEVNNSKLERDVRPSEQIIMVGCWLAMKEVSLLLGTIIRKIPLPSSTSDSSNSGGPFSDAADVPTMTVSDVILDLKQLETIGNHFLEVLLKMKHNGAIDKTRAGFTALCNRLLCSNDPRLCKLTESWMEQLMEKTVAKGQVVDDLLRRSAGIPAAFMALFLSEPEGTPKKLLPWALRWLIDVASRPLLDFSEANSTDSNLCNIPTELNQNTIPAPMEMNLIEKVSKIRDEGVVPTVHAFNVLRAVFNDTNLATDTSGFSAEAMIISIRSFSSPYWEVRNSACQAYTALVRRMIGFLNVQKRESARRALTGLEFFHRYPSLHSFLFNELKVATESLGYGSSRHSESNLANAVHPSLCPVLILLSRLKPSTITSEAGDALDPFLFMPFIRRCSTQSNLRVRVLASRALTGLVSNEKLPTVLLNIASELPFIENQVATFSSLSYSTVHGIQHVSFNSIHGMLLQLGALLDGNFRHLADFSRKDQILGDLMQVLLARSWIGSPRWCPCPILNASFLRVLDHMLNIVRIGKMSKKFGAICNLLIKLSIECLDIEASRKSLYYDPTMAELRKQAAKSYFDCVFQSSNEVAIEVLLNQPILSMPDSSLLETPEMENAFIDLQERLILSMSDVSYEVRLATLKWLFRFLKSTKSGKEANDESSKEVKIVNNWAKTNLQVTLMKFLDVEKNHKCSYYILRILFTWNLLQFEKHGFHSDTQTIYVSGMDCDSVFTFWDKLVSLYKLTKHSKTRESLICCMGICVKRFSGLLTNSLLSDQMGTCAQLYECIVHFMNLVKQNSASFETVNMRRAAAESIVASGLLEQAELIGSSVSNKKLPSETSPLCLEPNDMINMYARKILDTWFTCVKLLEDEDEVLRQKLAIDVQKLMARHGRIPTQVEKVIELSFEHLSSVFGHWLEYFDYLLHWVLNGANSLVSSTGDLVRRVFDKEIDNHHEEKLLISQICCFHLEKLPVSKERNFLLEWRSRFCVQLTSFAKGHIGKQHGVEWIGGVGNHKDAFLPLYANLLAFYVLSKCVFVGENESGTLLLADLVEVGKIIHPFLRNPLISNLYLLVVSEHEKIFGASVDHLISKPEDLNTIWDGFDPYFLLR